MFSKITIYREGCGFGPFRTSEAMDMLLDRVHCRDHYCGSPWGCTLPCLSQMIIMWVKDALGS